MSRTFGRVLVVNLENRSFKTMEVEPGILKKYIGGAGLSAYLYGQFAEAGAEPLSSGNPLFIMTGPLTGTPVVLSGRHGIAGRSPLTGFWGESSVGGHWGREFRRTGYDGMILLGRAEKPVYLLLRDEKLEFKDAAHLWGKDCFETDQMLKKEWGEKAQISCIGPAAEKLVRFCGVFTDGTDARTAGRCGLGTLMGSKKVKALVVQGTGEVPVLDAESLRGRMKELVPSLTGKMKGMSAFGTPGIVVPCESLGDLPVRNWAQGKYTEQAQRLSGQLMKEKYLKKQFFCASCPVGCGRVVAGSLEPFVEETGGPEYETLALLGSNCLIDDMPAVMRLNELTNRLGMDTIETGAAVSFCMEMYEKGLIGAKELGGLELKWGDARSAEELIRMIAERRGFGDLLAEGLQATAEKVGGRATEYAIQINNMALPAHDPRAYSSLALTYATSARGPCHTSSYTFWFERATIFPEVGIDKVLDRFQAEGKPEMTAKVQNAVSVWENLAMCKFSILGGVQLKDVSAWLKDVVGWDLSIQELLEVGERGINLKRKMNVAWGLSRKNDTLPLRVLTHRVDDGGCGRHLPPFNIMLADYYEKRGWDKEGIPHEETYRRLGI